MTEPFVNLDAELAVVPQGVEQLEVIGVRTGAFGAAGSGDTSGFGGLVSPIVMPGPGPERSRCCC